MSAVAPQITVDQVRALMKQFGLREPTEHETRAGKIFEKNLKDPDVGPGLRAAAKKEFPDLVFQEDEIDNRITAREKALSDQIAALTKRLEERDAAEAKAKSEADLESKVNSAVSKFNLTEEGRKAMLERMIAQGSTDADAAAALVAHNAPKPASTPAYLPQKMNLFGSAEQDEKYKLLNTRPDDFFDSEVAALIRDPDGYVRSAA